MGITINLDDHLLNELQHVVRSELKRWAPEGSKYLSLTEACKLKGVKKGTVESSHLYQPWIGYTYLKEGVKRYWPREAIEEWYHVFEHNRVEYIESLIKGGNPEVAQGVATEVGYLYYTGKAGYLYKLRGIIYDAGFTRIAKAYF